MKRNLWPYAIIAYFVVFIGAMATWIVFAVRNDHQLVRKDYYEQELKFQNDLDGQNRAAEVKVGVDYDSQEQTITLDLPNQADKGAIYFYRPSNAKLDRELVLDLENGKQTVNVRGFEEGLWKVRVVWTADGIEYRHNATLIFSPTKLSSL